MAAHRLPAHHDLNAYCDLDFPGNDIALTVHPYGGYRMRWRSAYVGSALLAPRLDRDTGHDVRSNLCRPIMIGAI